MSTRTFYHLTSQDSVESILTNGLEPRIGNNSLLIMEEKPAIYLSDLESLSYWIILLKIDKPALLKIELDDLACKKIEDVLYDNYIEYVCHDIINPSCISVDVDTMKFLSDIQRTLPESNFAMKNICMAFFDDISHMCRQFVRHYDTDTIKIDPERREWLQNQLTLLSRLDWSCLPQSKYCELLTELGESGEYTFDDRFKNKGKIWQEIAQFDYDEPEIKELAIQLSNFIQKNFPECLDLNTGGYTG